MFVSAPKMKGMVTQYLCNSYGRRTLRRLLTGLLELVEAWKRWDDFDILLNHREVKDFLWMCLLTGSNVSFASSYETHCRTNARLFGSWQFIRATKGILLRS